MADSHPAASRAPFLLLVGAGLAGACGVALAAIAAHKVDSPALVTAANMLIMHAAAIAALASLALARPGRGFIAVGALMLGAVSLFSGDVTVYTLAGHHLFPYAAPTGGSLTIGSWVLLAIAGLIAWQKS